MSPIFKNNVIKNSIKIHNANFGFGWNWFPSGSSLSTHLLYTVSSGKSWRSLKLLDIKQKFQKLLFLRRKQGGLWWGLSPWKIQDYGEIQKGTVCQFFHILNIHIKNMCLVNVKCKNRYPEFLKTLGGKILNFVVPCHPWVGYSRFSYKNLS